MARPEEFWSDLYGAFDPSEVLVGERSHHLYCEREHSPLNDMGPVFRITTKFARPPIAFFTGHRGSGKSSMLFRLLEQFQQHFFVVYFDIEHNLDSSKANQLDLLYLLGAAVYKAAENEGLKPDPKNLAELGKSLYTIALKEEKKPAGSVNYVELAKGVLVFTAGVLGSKVGAELAKAVLNPIIITSGISEETARKRDIEPNVQQVINNLNLMIADVQIKSGKSPLIVVDGLDKLQRLEQAKLIFLQSRALRGPVCRLIYTVPMLIYTLPEFMEATQDSRTYCLPNIKLYHKLKPDQRYEPGYITMHEVVSKRLETVNLKPEEIFEPKVLDLLVAKSGGVMRWLIRLVQDACMEASGMKLYKVNGAAAQRAIDNLVADLTFRLNTESIEELRKVRISKHTSNNSLCNELVHALLILAYRDDGETWFDVHPLLWNHIPAGE